MSKDENTCIEKVLAGDAAAYDSLVGKYQERLLAFLWNLLGSGEDARDAAQEVFIQAYVQLGRFNPGQRFKTWLFAIAYHHGIDLLRKRRSFRFFWLRETRSGHFQAPAAAVPIEESLLWRPLLTKVTPQERAVLALKYNEDCDTDEIAAALGCCESTVRVHLLNARRKLKKEWHAADRVDRGKAPQAEEVP